MLAGRRRVGDQRCLGIRVVFSEQPTLRLAPAWTTGSRDRLLKRRELPGIGVDSATACVCAAEVIPGVEAWMQRLYESRKSEPHANSYLSDKPGDLWELLRDNDAISAVSAASGMGDGHYPCYFSFDAEKKPVAFYVDFGFFGEPQWDWPTTPE
jgi:hypothetical protein